MQYMLAWGLPGGWEWIVILIVALLIFGKKLPDVGRSLGKGIIEFKKGLKGMKEELDDVDREVKDAVQRAEREADEASRETPRLSSERPSNPPVGERTKDKVEAES